MLDKDLVLSDCLDNKCSRKYFDISNISFIAGFNDVESDLNQLDEDTLIQS